MRLSRSRGHRPFRFRPHLARHGENRPPSRPHRSRLHARRSSWQPSNGNTDAASSVTLRCEIRTDTVGGIRHVRASATRVVLDLATPVGAEVSHPNAPPAYRAQADGRHRFRARQEAAASGAVPGDASVAEEEAVQIARPIEEIDRMDDLTSQDKSYLLGPAPVAALDIVLQLPGYRPLGDARPLRACRLFRARAAASVVRLRSGGCLARRSERAESDQSGLVTVTGRHLSRLSIDAACAAGYSRCELRRCCVL